MKKILIALVLMMSMVGSAFEVLPVNADLVCTQTVQGSTSINTAYIPFFQEKFALLFSSAGTDGIACDYTVDSTLWEVNGILEACEDTEGEGCAFVPSPFNNDCCCDQFVTLESEIFDVLNELTVEDRDIIVPQALTDLSAALDCLNTEYLAECMDGIDQDGEGTDYPNDVRCDAPWDASEFEFGLQTDKPVTSATYFNDVKPCYVRAIKDLGILEQVTSKTTQAFFLVQKLQELEVELQHKLALEDEQAIQDFTVGSETCVETGGAEAAIPQNLFISNIVNNGDGTFDLTLDASSGGSTLLTDVNLDVVFVNELSAPDFVAASVTVAGTGFSVFGGPSQVESSIAQAVKVNVLATPGIALPATVTITTPLGAEPTSVVANLVSYMDEERSDNMAGLTSGGAFANIVPPGTFPANPNPDIKDNPRMGYATIDVLGNIETQTEGSKEDGWVVALAIIPDGGSIASLRAPPGTTVINPFTDGLGGTVTIESLGYFGFVSGDTIAIETGESREDVLAVTLGQFKKDGSIGDNIGIGGPGTTGAVDGAPPDIFITAKPGSADPGTYVIEISPHPDDTVVLDVTTFNDATDGAFVFGANPAVLGLPADAEQTNVLNRVSTNGRVGSTSYVLQPSNGEKLTFTIPGSQSASIFAIYPSRDIQRNNNFLAGKPSTLAAPPWALNLPAPDLTFEDNQNYFSGTFLPGPTFTLRFNALPESVRASTIGAFIGPPGFTTGAILSEPSESDFTTFGADGLDGDTNILFYIEEGIIHDTDTLTVEVSFPLSTEDDYLGAGSGTSANQKSHTGVTYVAASPANGGGGVMTSITGAFSAAGISDEQGLFSIAIAAIIVVGIFLYVLRRKS
jgi:hypothetical protein